MQSIFDNVLFDGIGSVALIDHMGDDKSVVNAARVSLGQQNDAPFNESDEKLMRYLYRNKHGSPFEHTSLQYHVKCPLFVRSQWMRHRVGVSYNEISARYVEVKDEVYLPLYFRGQSKSNRQASVEGLEEQGLASDVFRSACMAAIASYRQLLSIGVAREQARAVLPQSMYTEFYFTCNLRSLFHFVELRDHQGAQWEIQQYAKALVELAKPHFPTGLSVFEEFRYE